MTYASPLAMPWARPEGLYCVPGQLILKLALGEAPDAIPSDDDVRRRAAEPAANVDGGPIDRILSHFMGARKLTRVHTAAAGRNHVGHGHLGFDDIEQSSGVARTFRLEADTCCNVFALADALRQLPMVESVSPQYLATLPFGSALAPSPTDAIAREDEWMAQRQIGAALAMAYEPGDPAVIIGIVDTGVAHEHTELTGKLRSGYDSVQLGQRHLAAGIELVGDRQDPDAEPEDEVGHGTSVASIIGGIGRNIPPGLAGACSILPIRVLGSARLPGEDKVIGIGALSDIDAGVKTAIDLGARVLNMSFGTPADGLDPNDPVPHQDVVRYGAARGCVMVAASGNSGMEARFYPAALDHVIAVGSVDAEGSPSKFSTRGEHVDISAPGELILSASIDGYQRATGTSFAAPYVTATAALLVSRALRRSVPIDSDDVARSLRVSARPWPRSGGEGMGAGTLDAHAALNALESEINARQTQAAPGFTADANRHQGERDDFR